MLPEDDPLIEREDFLDLDDFVRVDMFEDIRSKKIEAIALHSGDKRQNDYKKYIFFARVPQIQGVYQTEEKNRMFFSKKRSCQ